MCQRIIQFCSGSTKPLVFAGSLLTLLLAIGLGYLACSSNALLQDIDPTLAQQRSLTYHLQLVASAYLILISVFACFAAHYDQKHSIRALAGLTSINFLIAVAAILLVPSADIGSQMKQRLVADAMTKYDFKLKPEAPPAPNVNDTIPTNSTLALVNPSSPPDAAGKPKQKRMADAASDQATPAAAAAAPLPALNGTQATKLWDSLQKRGCCGFTNSTDWPTKLPKSCCSKPDEEKDEYFCKTVDEQHKSPCLPLIESIVTGTKNLSLLLVLALIALVNLYLANVTGISAYRTFHYNEASQNAYS